jgi:hypothetical protein
MKKTGIVSALACMIILLSGCTGPAVNKKASEEIRSIAVISASISKAGKSNINTRFLQGMAEFALETYLTELRGLDVWEVMPVDKVKSSATIKALDDLAACGTLKRAAVKLSSSPWEYKMDMAMTAKGADSVELIPEVLVENTESKILSVGFNFASASGMPNIPYPAIAPKPKPGLKIDLRAEITAAIMPGFLGNIAEEMGVDAVGILTLHVSAGKNEKGDGMIRMKPAFCLYTQSGVSVVDFKWPELDDLSPAKHGVPLFSAKTGKIDLKRNPQTEAAYRELIKTTSQQFAAELRKALGLEEEEVAGEQ